MSVQTASAFPSPQGTKPVSLWNRLTAPSRQIEEAEPRRRARLLMIMLLVMVLALITGMMFTINSGEIMTASMQGVALLLVVVAYGISRTRHYLIAATLTVISLSMPSFVLVLTGRTVGDYGVTSALSWLVLPIALGSLWFSLRGTAIMAGLEIGAILLMPFVAADAPWSNVGGALGFIGTVCGLSLVVAGMRASDQKQIREQISQLNALNVALVKSVDQAEAATAKANEANRLKSQFLATMSHELRTPLNAIIGFAEIMTAGMGGEIDDDAKHMVERIHANSQRLLELINDVLDLSKIQAQRVEVSQKLFSPRNLATALHTSLSSLATKKGLDFEVEVAAGVPENLMGDETLLARIATNLLSNAIKFTDAGCVRLKLDSADPTHWSMTVKDTGIGIPPHAMNFIFDPFRQVDGSPQRAYGGSGLGLAITRELVRAMGGQITVNSVVDEGSTFIVELPIVVAETPATAAPTQ